jgi:hypothetical protein
MSTQQQTTPKQHTAEHGKVVIEEEKEAGTKVSGSERAATARRRQGEQAEQQQLSAVRPTQADAEACCSSCARAVSDAAFEGKRCLSEIAALTASSLLFPPLLCGALRA